MPGLIKKSLRCGYVDVGEGQIHYRYSKISDTRPLPLLVLLHQSPSASVMYEQLMLALAEHFEVLALDTPGFGQSDALEGAASIAALTLVLHSAKSQIDPRPCYVFGHHTGAAIAVEWAATFPQEVTCLALSGPPLLDENLKSVLVERASLFPQREDGQHLISMWHRIRDKDRQAPLSLSVRELCLALRADTAYPQSYQAVVDHNFAEQLTNIMCPTLVLAGGKDPLYGSVEPTLKKLKNAHKGELPAQSGTYVCDLNTDAVAQQLTSFWQQNS